MSLVKKCLDYAAAHDGALPSFEKMDRLVHEQLGEYLKELSGAVIPEYFDIPIITAAYRLLYESRYNMLEPKDKALCDSLVQTSKIISTESVVRK